MNKLIKFCFFFLIILNSLKQDVLSCAAIDDSFCLPSPYKTNYYDKLYKLNVDDKCYFAALAEKKYWYIPLIGDEEVCKSTYCIRISKETKESFFCIADSPITIEQFFKTTDGFCICGYIENRGLYILKIDNNLNKIYLRDDLLNQYNINVADVTKIEVLQTNLDKILKKNLYILPENLVNIVADYTRENFGIRIYTNKDLIIDYVI